MPIYEYSCEDCQHVFEEWQKDFTDKEMTCPVCGGLAKRMISNTAFILKGSGWYVTDYARGSSASASGNGGNGNGDQAEASSSTEKSTTGESSTSSDSGEGAKTASTQEA
ncbi:MAG: zinc ribbon domain-containing protein [Desulfovermiculus sp.]